MSYYVVKANNPRPSTRDWVTAEGYRELPASFSFHVILASGETQQVILPKKQINIWRSGEYFHIEAPLWLLADRGLLETAALVAVDGGNEFTEIYARGQWIDAALRQAQGTGVV